MKISIHLFLLAFIVILSLQSAFAEESHKKDQDGKKGYKPWHGHPTRKPHHVPTKKCITTTEQVIETTTVPHVDTNEETTQEVSEATAEVTDEQTTQEPLTTEPEATTESPTTENEITTQSSASESSSSEESEKDKYKNSLKEIHEKLNELVEMLKKFFDNWKGDKNDKKLIQYLELKFKLLFKTAIGNKIKDLI